MPRRKNRRSRQSSSPKIPCKYCGTSVVQLLECSTCKRKLYCSVECQLGDLKNHKTDCDGRTSEQKMEKPSEKSHEHQVPPVIPVSKKEERCDSCGKSGVKLQKCSRCHEVMYCSKKCQKADWPNHKVDCEENGKIPADTSAKNSEEECDSCGKSGVKLQKCSRCHEVKYCSKKCQKAEWPNHKVECEENGKIPAGASAENSEEKCDSCGKSGIKLQKCSRCHKVKYCSKKCQKAKWPDHKVDCEKNGKIPTGASAENSESICCGCLSVCKSTYCDACVMRHTFSEIILTRAIEKNRQITRSMYPDFEVITKFAHIKHSPLFPFIRFKQVLVSRMSRRGHHFFRPSMDLIDEDGNVFCLIFYLDDSAEHLSFPWHRFQPGNYICIPFPRVHLFMDGSIGFRVEDTADVRIIGNISADKC